MREILIGIAAVIVVAICAGVWLDTAQVSVTDRYSVPSTVRL